MAPKRKGVKELVRSALKSAPTAFYSASMHYIDCIRPIETSKLQYWIVVVLNQGLKPDLATNTLVTVDVKEDRFDVGGNHRSYVSTRIVSEVRGYNDKIYTEVIDQIRKVSAEELKGYDSGKPETSIFSHVLTLRDHLAALLPREIELT
eukprot:IDg3188t1